ncbi:UNVERIFIED_CONTAM: hypothetical protein Sindi_1316500 [Sesamum indicum]
MNRLTVTPQTKNPTTTPITQISVSHGHRDPYKIFHKELWRMVKEINSLIHVLAERENPLFKGVKTVVEKENLGGFPKTIRFVYENGHGSRRTEGRKSQRGFGEERK